MNLIWNALRDQRIRAKRLAERKLMIRTIPENTSGLPLGVSVDIEQNGNELLVCIKARLHSQKSYTLPHTYSLDWTPEQILRDGDFLKYLARYQ